MTNALSRAGLARAARALVMLSAVTVASMATPIAAGDDAAPAATVTMTGKNGFAPETIEIKPGDTVLWKNTSTKVHTVTADATKAKDSKHVELPPGAAPFDSGKIKPGGTYSHTFTTAGRYTYFCIPHEDVGMIGHVIVKK